MSGVDIQLLKRLREITFAPLKDCREALIESNWDFDKALDILKEKWMSKASKKADRLTNEWLIKVIKKDWRVYALKLLCETDFVVKNDLFSALFDDIMDKICTITNDIDNLSQVDKWLLDQMNGMVTEFIGKLGENTKLEDIIVSNKNAYVYNHPGNKVASIIYYTGDEDTAKELALQVAAMNPEYLSFESVPQSYRDELLEKFKAEMLDSDKPANIVEQIIAGKLQKYLSDLVLLEQEYIRDNSKKIKDIMPSWFEVTGYTRLSI